MTTSGRGGNRLAASRFQKAILFVISSCLFSLAFMFLRSKADPIELRLLNNTRSWEQRLVNHQGSKERERGGGRALTSNAERKHTDHNGRNVS